MTMCEWAIANYPIEELMIDDCWVILELVIS
jgi:hypothetical protein